MLTVLGGPALFLLGHALFKWSVFEHLSVARLVAIAALVAVIPLARVVSPLVTAIAAALIVAAVAWWGMRTESGAAFETEPTAVGERAHG